MENYTLTPASGLLSAPSVIDQPFRPIGLATVRLTVGPTATTAGSMPVALASVIPVGWATSYRIRVSSSSTSPVAFILTTDNTKTAVFPTAFTATGSGGTRGDKVLDAGAVEVFGLTALQQNALAAGTLYISAVTPAGGSADITVTPGVGA